MKLPNIENETELVKKALTDKATNSVLADELGISPKLFSERLRNQRNVKINLDDFDSLDTFKEFYALLDSSEYLASRWLATDLRVMKNKVFEFFVSDDELEEMYVKKEMTLDDIVNLLGIPDIITKEVIKRRTMKLNLKHGKEFSKKTLTKAMEDPEKRKVAQKAREQTMVERYGVRVPLKNKSIVEKAKETVQNKYGVNNVFQVEEFKAKQRETMLTNYGKEHYHQSLESRLDSLSWHETEYVHTKEQVIELLTNNSEGIADKAIKFLETIRDNENRKSFTLHEVADILGVRYSTLISQRWGIHPDGDLIKVTRRGAQTEVAEYIKSLGFDVVEDKFYSWFGGERGQQIDIFVPELNLGVEYNGLYFHATSGSSRGKGYNYHQQKTDIAREHGVTLFHIWEQDWQTPIKREIIKSQLAYKLHANNIRHIYARKTIVGDVSVSEAEAFLDENHIQGGVSAYGEFRKGLFYNGELVALMTFGHHRFSKDSNWELIRFTNKTFTDVVGGASKLLKQFTDTHPGETVISYANNDFAHGVEGSMYARLGFELIGHTQPGYHWVNPKTFEVLNRQRVQPKKLVKYSAGEAIAPFPNASKDFRSVNTNETENDYMVRNGWLKVYNAGNDTYQLKIM